jgi:hypothetical protein
MPRLSEEGLFIEFLEVCDVQELLIDIELLRLDVLVALP